MRRRQRRRSFYSRRLVVAASDAALSLTGIPWVLPSQVRSRLRDRGWSELMRVAAAVRYRALVRGRISH